MKTLSAIGLALCGAVLCVGGNAMASQQAQAAPASTLAASSVTKAPTAQSKGAPHTPAIIFFG